MEQKDKNKILDEFLEEHREKKEFSTGNAINKIFRFLLLIIATVVLFIGLSAFIVGLFAIFYKSLENVEFGNMIFVILPLIILGIYYRFIKIDQIEKTKSHCNLFLLFHVFIGWQMILFYLILLDISYIIEDGWGYGYFIKTGAMAIIGSILTVINFPILSLIYFKSEGLK